MDQFKKMFKKTGQEGEQALKHSRSMPLRSSSKGKALPSEENGRPVYRGKTPLKTSDIVYVEQRPGMLDIERTQWMSPHGPSAGHLGSYHDLIGQFPDTPRPPPVPPRSPLRSTSLNTRQVPVITITHPTLRRERTVQRSSSVACFSRPTNVAYPELASKALPALPKETPSGGNHLYPSAASRYAGERARAQSHAAKPPRSQRGHVHAHTHPPIASTSSPASRTRAALRHAPSAVSLGSPARPRLRQEAPLALPPLAQGLEQSKREACRRAPIAPPVDPNTPEHLMPIFYDWDDPVQSKVNFSLFTHAALESGRALHVRDNGVVRCMVPASEHQPCVPDEVGIDWYASMIKYEERNARDAESRRQEQQRLIEERQKATRGAHKIMRETVENYNTRTGRNVKIPAHLYD
ncbi:hypothetical protein BJ138DRAFT_1212401 [Hygrophoropsis aurantiaca]|uniref:Uncharacterized protein n=1 Tax=Hygrophoropsis aurantiaca TaxID=72124 RepID=A0ACB8AMG3_9AGAM|nr:hypothetical protein BJ138DRAFT_1212401 [Hygrophoropsis aurantiaca]